VSIAVPTYYANLAVAAEHNIRYCVSVSKCASILVLVRFKKVLN